MLQCQMGLINYSQQIQSKKEIFRGLRVIFPAKFMWIALSVRSNDIWSQAQSKRGTIDASK